MPCFPVGGHFWFHDLDQDQDSVASLTLEHMNALQAARVHTVGPMLFAVAHDVFVLN
jgi:hypothetical protein